MKCVSLLKYGRNYGSVKFCGVGPWLLAAMSNWLYMCFSLMLFVLKIVEDFYTKIKIFLCCELLDCAAE